VTRTRDTTRKGTCPVCGQAVPLYKGALRSHQQRPTPLHPHPVTCPGGTRQPGPHEAAGHDRLF
jgi:hypothetical protein